jgi:hypothetical protein
MGQCKALEMMGYVTERTPLRARARCEDNGGMSKCPIFLKGRALEQVITLACKNFQTPAANVDVV